MSYKFETTVGGCLAWNAFVQFALTLEASGTTANSITMVATGDIQQSKPASVTCSSATNATMLVNNLRSGVDSLLTVECDGYSWKVSTCDGSTAMCIDCDDPCTAKISYSNPFVFNPCSRSAYIPMSTFVTVDVSSGFDVPCVLDSSVVPMQDSAEIHFGLTSLGQVFCAAYATGTQEVTIASIFSQRNEAKSYPRKDTVVRIEGLSPSTEYAFFCVGGGLNAQAVSVPNNQYSSVFGRGEVFRTTCCNNVVVSFDLVSMPVNAKTVKSFTIGMKYAPSATVVVDVEVIKKLKVSAVEQVVGTYSVTFTSKAYGTQSLSWPLAAFRTEGDLSLRATAKPSSDVTILFERFGVVLGSVVDDATTQRTRCTESVAVVATQEAPYPVKASYLENGRTIAVTFSQEIDTSAFQQSVFSCNGIVTVGGGISSCS